MPRGVFIPDVKVLTDHYLIRHQRGGNIVGYRGARMQHGYGIGGIFMSLARYAIPMLKKSAKAVGRRALKAGAQVAQDVADGENVVVSPKTRGKQAVNDFMAGRGRKRPIKRAALKKTAIRTPAKKRKTSLDSYKPNWHGS
jgi:hypothetical protein